MRISWERRYESLFKVTCLSAAIIIMLWASADTATAITAGQSITPSASNVQQGPAQFLTAIGSFTNGQTITVKGDLTYTAEAAGSVTVSYDYKASLDVVTGQQYSATAFLDDYFWSGTSSSIVLSSIVMNSTITNTSNNQTAVNISIAPTSLPVGGDIGASSPGTEVGLIQSPTMQFTANGPNYQLEINSTYIFTGVNANDTLHIDLPEETNVNSVPEPRAVVLIGSGLAGLVALRKKFGNR